MEDEWIVLLEKTQETFSNFENGVTKLQSNLPQGKNLAQLQGVSRREKDALQTFDETTRDLREQLEDISVLQPDLLIKTNNDMVSSCILFEDGGNYDSAEVEWYRGQMEEINQMIENSKQMRIQRVREIDEQIARLLIDPERKFNAEYKHSIDELSAKDGLGKTFG